MNVPFLHTLFPYLPPSDWVSIVRTCKDTAQNSNLIQQQVFSARFHLKVTIPEKTPPGAIYTFHKQFAQNPAVNTWALRTRAPVHFSCGRLNQCILIPGPRVIGLSEKALEIHRAEACVATLPLKRKFDLLAASKNGQTIALASSDGDIVAFSLVERKRIQSIASSNISDLAARYGAISLKSLAFFPDGRLFTAYHTQTTGFVIVWDFAQKNREKPISLNGFSLEVCALSPSGRSFIAQGIEFRDDSPRSFECDQPLSTPKAKPPRVTFLHRDFAQKKRTQILVRSEQKPFAIVSDDTFVAVVDDPNAQARLQKIQIFPLKIHTLENLANDCKISNLCLGTNGLLHATTQRTASPRNELCTYDLSTCTRICCISLSDLPDHSGRTLFLSSIPGALAFATAQNGHANFFTFRSAAPSTAASSCSSSAAREVIDLINDSLDLHLSPSLPSQPSVPLASPKALPLNSPPEPPKQSPSVERKRRYQLTLSTAAASSSSSSSSSAPPPAKHRRTTLELTQK